MARQSFRRVSTVVLGLFLAVAVGAGTPAFAGTPTSAHSAPAQKRADQKWYQVQPSYQGQPEFLFEIAQRFLGNGNRLTEIFNLNKGRVQADGGAMTKPETIAAGWILLLPADAKGDGVQTGPLPSVAPTAPAASAPAAPTTASTAAATSPADAAPATGKSGGSSLLVILLIVLGVLILAGIAVAVVLTRRRGGGTPAKAAGPGYPPAAPAAPKGNFLRQRGKPAGAGPTRNFDTAASWTIDRARRVLAMGAAAAGRPVPPVYGVSLDENRIVLRLAAPDGQPSDPWEAVENGRIWRAGLRDLQALPASNDVRSPCPRLVTLGTADGVRELVDLGQTTGVISVQGDATAARDLVAAWAEELISSPWTGGVRVVAGALRPGLIGRDRLTSVDSVRDALTAAEGDQPAGAPALRGGQPTAADGAGLGVLILGSAPGNRDMERVQSLLSRPDAAWVVVVLGQTRQDRWRFTIHPDGRLDTGALGITVYTGGVAVSR
jgi:flagellar basal body-associated protein FliL